MRRVGRACGVLCWLLLSAAGAGEAPDDGVKRAHATLLAAYDTAIAELTKQGNAEDAGRLQEEKRAIERTLVALRRRGPDAKEPLDAERLAEYAGHYVLPDERVHVVTVEEGRLFAQAPWERRRLELSHVAADTFVQAGTPQLYTFYRDAAGKVVEAVPHRSPERARRFGTADTATLRVSALLDGRSRLIVRADTVQWHHLDYDAPGITARGEVVPTEINGVAWTPVWPDLDGLRNRFATRRSSVLRGLDPPLPRGPVDVSLALLRGAGRVEIIDLPRVENDYALTVEIEDHPNGANRYELEMRFRPAAEARPEPAHVAAAIPTDGLVLHLPLNGDAKDASGKGRHGTAEAIGPAKDRFGKEAGACAFGGEGSYIRVPAPPREANAPLSLSAWVQYTKTGRDWNGAILTRDGERGRLWLLAALWDRVAFCGTGRWPYVGRLRRAAPGTWHHVVAVFDGRRYELYLGGELLDARAGELPAGDAEPITIGGRPGHENGMWLSGAIDDMRLYHRALTWAEVRALTHEGGYGDAPLVPAAARGSLEAIKKLVADGADINAVDVRQRGPLYVAAEAGHRDVVEYLLAKGAKPSTSGPRGEMPVHAAARGGFLEILTALVGANADVNAVTRERRTPLHAAAAIGHAGCVRLLLEAGADPGAADARANTPLHRAAAYGRREAAKLLLKMGARLDAPNRRRRTPAQTARDFRQGEMADWLDEAARKGRGAAEF